MVVENEKQALLDYVKGDINEYDLLTAEERRKQNKINAKNGYGISQSQLITLIRKHKKAREKFDVKTIAKIEYRLTDINFHCERNMIHNGNYDDAVKLH